MAMILEDAIWLPLFTYSRKTVVPSGEDGSFSIIWKDVERYFLFDLFRSLDFVPWLVVDTSIAPKCLCWEIQRSSHRRVAFFGLRGLLSSGGHRKSRIWSSHRSRHRLLENPQSHLNLEETTEILQYNKSNTTNINTHIYRIQNLIIKYFLWYKNVQIDLVLIRIQLKIESYCFSCTSPHPS